MRKTALVIVGIAIAFLAMPSISRAQVNGPCPNIGLGPGCGVIITLGSGGASLANGSGIPYDGSDDTLIGVVNNSGGTVSSISLSGNGIFFFDGDGASSGFSCAANGPIGCTLGTDPTGYAGPGNSFTITDGNDGSVNFTGGLANGATAWFSLEEPLTQASFTVTGVTGAPEPASLLLLGTGLIGLLGLRRRLVS